LPVAPRLRHGVSSGCQILAYRLRETLHRIDPEVIVRRAQAAGFRLEAHSDVLRNPRDTHQLRVFDAAVHGRTDQVILSVGVEPSALDKVKPDLPVNLVSQMTGRKPLEGKVKRVGASIDMKTRLVPTIIEIPAGSVLAGENFRAGIVVGKFQGWIVPRDSVSIGNKGPFIFQIDEGHAKKVYVNVLGSVGKNSIIEGDISSQREIVLKGNYQLEDGAEVRPEEAAADEEEEEE